MDSNWRDNVPQFKWKDYGRKLHFKMRTLVATAELPFGCKVEIVAAIYDWEDDSKVVYTSYIIAGSHTWLRDAFTLEDAKAQARESWLWMLHDALGLEEDE